MKEQQKIRPMLILGLCLCMILSALFLSVTVYADEPANEVNLPGIQLYEKVEFAEKEWWVIGLNLQGIHPRNGTMTLLSEKGLFVTDYDTDVSRGEAASSLYDGSLLQKKLDNYYNDLDASEKAIILPRRQLDGMTRNHDTGISDGTLTGDYHVWPLSYDEATMLPKSPIRAIDTPWWLRTGWTYDTYSVSQMYHFGEAGWGRLTNPDPTSKYAATGRPALTIDLSSSPLMLQAVNPQ